MDQLLSLCESESVGVAAFVIKAESNVQDILRFGTLGDTLYYLSLCSMDGISWVEVSDTLLMIGPSLLISLCAS